MANDGWFKCEDCGYAVKAKVPDYVQQLSSPCPHCGGKHFYKETDTLDGGKMKKV